MSSEWSPITPFSAVYASAVIIHCFGVPMDDVLNWAHRGKRLSHFFVGGRVLPGGPTNAAHAADKLRRNQAAADEGNYSAQKAARWLP